MKKLLLLAVAVLAATVTLNAQTKRWNIGFGGGVALPAADLADYTSVGLTGFVFGSFNITKGFSGGVELGFTTLTPDAVDDIDLDNTTIRSFLFKGVYTFSKPQIRPYVSLFTGFYSSRISKCLYVNEDETKSTIIMDNSYGYGIEAGIRKGKFNFGTAYHVVAIDFKYVLFKLGYTISF